MSPYLNVEECAEYLRLKPKTIYDWVHDNKIPYRKHGSRTVFHKDELDEWSRAQRPKKAAPSLSKFQQVKMQLSSGSLKTERNPMDSKAS